MSRVLPQAKPARLDLELDEHWSEPLRKLVLYGRKVGVPPEEMISLINSGISIRDLLAFLASKSSGNA